MKDIGVHYKKPTELIIGNRERIICYEGLKLWTLKETTCQCDLHYFVKNARVLPKNAEIAVLYCWQNFYGKYVRTLIDKKIFDIKTEDLTYRL